MIDLPKCPVCGVRLVKLCEPSLGHDWRRASFECGAAAIEGGKVLPGTRRKWRWTDGCPKAMPDA